MKNDLEFIIFQLTFVIFPIFRHFNTQNSGQPKKLCPHPANSSLGKKRKKKNVFAGLIITSDQRSMIGEKLTMIGKHSIPPITLIDPISNKLYLKFAQFVRKAQLFRST